MIRFIIPLFSLISLSLNAITAQQVFKGAQLLYTAVAQNDLDAANKIKADNKRLKISTPELLKQARKIAKENRDAQSTQYLTEQIIEAQKSFSTRYQGYIASVAAIGIFISGLYLGTWFRARECIGGNSCSYIY